jgi:DNA-binding NtrC family response regulator
LFTDVIMPGGMNGLQLVDEAHRLRPRLPVLAKPYKHGDLLARVEAVLRA